jgi:serine/threonine-protein kinase
MPNADADLLARVTRLLAPAYVIGGELGRGGMGIVYRARDARLKRTVAVKLLPPELAYRQEIRTRFLREAELSAQLSHPNIVPIYTVDERDGLVYFVMGFVDGETLAARLAARGPLPVDEVRSLMRQIADALAYAHAAGVVHRDIKPDNILLAPREGGGTPTAMVTDFGIARAVNDGPTDPGAAGRLTATGVAIGTPAYMSPEQCAGDREVDGRSDLYALGVLTYHMLAGRPPFLGSNSASILVKQLTERPVPISERRPDVPADLAAIVMRLLAKQPDDRFPDAATLVRALDGEAVSRPSPRDASGRPASGASRRPRGATQPALSAGRFAAAGVTGEELGAALRTRDGFIGMRVPPPYPLVPSGPGAEESADDVLLARARKYRRNVASMTGTLGMLTMLNLITSPHALWVVWPAFGIGWSVIASTMRLWGDGINPFTILTRGADAAVRAAPALPGDGPLVATRLASAAVLDGPFGATVRRAVADHGTIVQLVDSLPPTERAQLPDVLPTAKGLVDQIATLATVLHRIDVETPEDVRGGLADRRAALAEQLDRAALALQTLALDLVRYRAGGLATEGGGVASATQEAQALSREIGYILSANDELRADLNRSRTGGG